MEVFFSFFVFLPLYAQTTHHSKKPCIVKLISLIQGFIWRVNVMVDDIINYDVISHNIGKLLHSLEYVTATTTLPVLFSICSYNTKL